MGPYLWLGLAGLIVWYLLDLSARFPSWIMGLQVLLVAAATALVWQFLSGIWWKRLSAAIVIGSFAVSQVHNLLGIPFAFFLLLALGFWVAWAIGSDYVRANWPSLTVVPASVGLIVLAVGAPFALMQYAVWRDTALSHAGVALEHIEAAGAPYPETMGDPWEAAEAYEPFWLFSAGERWKPSTAEDYLAGAWLVTPSGERPAAPIADPDASDEETCRSEGSRGCRITIRCPSEDDPCADDRDSRPVVYVHVIDDPLAKEGLEPDDSLVGRTRRVIEYWAFYRYDAWSGWAGLFRQWHESDWEAVVVGLGEEEPLWVAFSSHCGGSWRRWDNVGGMAGVRSADGRLLPAEGHPPGHHPLAFVGEGTHATFPDDFRRQPDWDSCAKKVPLAFHAATFGPTYGSGVREDLDQVDAPDDFYGPEIVPVRGGEPAFMRFRGTWAVEDHLDIVWMEDQGGGPPTPPLQRMWTEPLALIFCGDYWEPKTECPTR